MSDTNYKIDSSLDNIISELKAANDTFGEALDLMTNNVYSKLENDDIWAGEGKKVGLLICEICQKYHTKLYENLQSEVTTLEKLYKSANDYMNNGNIPSKMR